MAKPVGSRCNLRCSYCYYLETGVYSGSSSLRMSDALLERYIYQYIAASPGPAVQFTWHGGEPSLAGIEFYRRAVALQEKYLPEGWACWNNLQTNGVLLDDETWCAFLAENKFDVGLSLDGGMEHHDTYRKDIAGRGSYTRAAEAVRRLQAHGIQPDLLCTVTSTAAEDPLGVYRALREMNTGWVQFIPIVRPVGGEGRVTEDSVTGKAYGNFLCTIFDEWLYHDLGRLDVQLFAEAALVGAGGAASLCWMAPVCGRVVIVEQDGSVYSCDHFVNGDHCIGHIEASDLGTLVDLPRQGAFGAQKREGLPSRCRNCRWLHLCNGGCPKDRIFFTEAGEPGLNCLCEGFQQFFSHAQEPLARLMALRAKGAKPKEIMAEMRAAEAGKWKGIGRNDPCPCGSGRKAKQCCWSKRP